MDLFPEKGEDDAKLLLGASKSELVENLGLIPWKSILS